MGADYSSSLSERDTTVSQSTEGHCYSRINGKLDSLDFRLKGCFKVRLAYEVLCEAFEKTLVM